jgi:lipopolysaccharide/colanic/teichoic acid biosynthesis glycosyltransferase
MNTSATTHIIHNTNILYVGSNPEAFEVEAKKMKLSMRITSNSIQVQKMINNGHKIEAIICEENLPGNQGITLFQENADRIKQRGIVFILLSETYREKLYSAAFKYGINDCFESSSIAARQVFDRIQSIIKFQKIEATIPQQKQLKKFKFPISKRVFDIVFASLALLVLSPFLLLIMLLIRLESKGKVYYIAKRVGRKSFDFYKFRSMRSGSDQLIKQLAKEKNQYSGTVKKRSLSATCPKCGQLPAGKHCSTLLFIDEKKVCEYWYNYNQEEKRNSESKFIKINNDPRVTRIGAFIRNTSIDELPQLINVLKGDMSIVGNRPLPVYEAELLTEDNMLKRFLAPAGITGLWQVELRGRKGNMSEEERIKLDNIYSDYFVGHQYSFWYDIKLILRTIPALIQKNNV